MSRAQIFANLITQAVNDDENKSQEFIRRLIRYVLFLGASVSVFITWLWFILINLIFKLAGLSDQNMILAYIISMSLIVFMANRVVSLMRQITKIAYYETVKKPVVDIVDI